MTSSLQISVAGAWRSITRGLRRKTGDPATDLYFEPAFADALETWAIDSAWPEIRLLLAGCAGKVLDLACGTGRAYDFLKDNEALDYYGCDLSPLFIERATGRGIPADHLKATDATNLDYPDGAFDQVFSIGSLEHFSRGGLKKAITECRRISRGANFHMVPLSRSGFNEGWISPHQSYWNNSEAWWRGQFALAFGQDIQVMPSKWQDNISRGAWFITRSDNS